jgi:hypothetical protein
MSETYRNHYAVDGPLADEMAISPFWDEGARYSGGLRNFYVNRAGCEALASHLREIGDPHRAFVVTYAGYSNTVIATSRDKAKYARYIEISDVMPDLEFVDFCRRVSVSSTDLGRGK